MTEMSSRDLEDRPFPGRYSQTESTRKIDRNAVRGGRAKDFSQNLILIPTWQLRAKILKSID